MQSQPIYPSVKRYFLSGSVISGGEFALLVEDSIARFETGSHYLLLLLEVVKRLLKLLTERWERWVFGTLSLIMVMHPLRLVTTHCTTWCHGPVLWIGCKFFRYLLMNSTSFLSIISLSVSIRSAHTLVV